MSNKQEINGLQTKMELLENEAVRLRNENSMLKAMMEKILNECGDAVSIYALDKGFENEKFYFVNQTWCDIHGYNRIDVMRNSPQAMHESIIRKLDAEILAQLKMRDSAYRNIQQIARNGCDYESSERFKLIRGDDCIYVASITRDDTLTGEMKRAISKRTRYEEAVSVSSHILLTEKYSDNALQKILNLLQSVTGVSRVSLVENDIDGETAKLVNEAISMSSVYFINHKDFQNFNYNSTYSRWKEILAADGVIWGKIETLPEQEQIEMQKRGTASLLVISVQRGNKWYGFLSFEDSHPEREWLFEDISLIITTAEIIGAFLHHKKTEAEVIKERDLAQLYLNVAGSIITVLDNDGIIRMVNKKGCEVLEESESRIIGKNFFSCFSPENSRDILRREFDSIMESPKNHERLIENTIRSAKGNFKVISWHLSIIKNDAGERVGLLASGENITERKRAEEELKQKEQQFRDMFYEHSAVMLLIASDNQGAILDANKAATSYYGYTLKELKRKTFFNLHDIDFPASGIHSENYLKNKGNYFITKSILQNGEKRDIEIYITPIQADNKIALFSIIHDITERVKAEAALKISEERLHLALEATNDGLWDANTEKIYFSPRACVLLGKEPEEFEPTPEEWLQSIHPDDYKRAQEIFVEHLLNWTEGYEMEIRISDNLSHYKWFNIKGKIVETDNHGNFKRGVGTLSDISDKKALENNLRISQQRLELAIQGAGIGLWDYNISGNNFLMPDHTEDNSGETAFNDYIVTFPEIQKMIHSDDAPLVIKNLEKHIRGLSKQFQAEFRIQPTPDEWRWLLAKGRIVEFGEGGRPLRMSGTHIDITESKKLENKIAEQKLLYETMLTATPEIIIFKDTQFVYRAANSATFKLFKFNENDIIGKTDYDLFDEKTARKTRDEEEYVLKYGTSINYEIDSLPIENEEMKDSFFQKFVIPVFDNKGRKNGILISIIDITERKKAEMVLQKAKDNLEIEVEKRTAELVTARDRAERINKLKDEFLAYISHELRTPLSLINLNTELLIKRNLLTGKDLEKLVQTENAVNTAVHIIEDIIDISRIEAGEMDVNLHTFYLPRLVEEVITSVKYILDGENRRITSDIEVGQIYSDSKRIRQVLTNLISNAVKYSEKGNIFVTAKQESENITFSVIDQGKGISVDNLNKIFEPFFREDDTKYRKKSMGLGLTICKKIIDNLGGTINVKSEAGKGSCFTFAIPFIKENIDDRAKYFF